MKEIGNAALRTSISTLCVIVLSVLFPTPITPQGVVKGVIHVRVFQPNGELVHIPVELVEPSKFDVRPLTLMRSSQKPEENSTGEYQFKVSPGDYYVRTGSSVGPYMRTYYPNTSNPEDAKAIKVSAGEQVTAEIHLSGEPTFRISGRIVDSLPDREPHYYAGVSLRSSNSVVQEIKLMSATPGIPFCCAVERVPDLDVSVTTQDDRFEISGVRRGKYELIASMMVGEMKPGDFVMVKVGQKFPYSRSYSNLVELNVSDGNLENIKIEITHGVDLTGGIVSNGKAVKANNVYVELTGRDSVSNSLQSTNTDKKGQFVFPGLLQGKYNLSVGKLPGNAYVESILQDTKVIPGSRGLSLRSTVSFEFDKANSGPLRIIVNSNGGTISGMVNEGSEAAIVLVSAETSTDRAVIRWGRTDSIGSFKFPDGVPPGQYRIYALPKGSIDLIFGVSVKLPERFVIRGTDLTVKSGERVFVRLNRINSE